MRRFLPSLRGLGASLLAHAALLLLLALLTLKIPSPPASLALQSATLDSPSELLELPQTMEVSRPLENITPPAEAPKLNPEKFLADVPQRHGPPLSQMPALPTSSLPHAALQADASQLASTRGDTASFFGTAASGNCFCFVIDGSGSMRGGAWEAAKRELLRSLASFSEEQRFYIIFFNRELSVLPMPGQRQAAPRALYATAENLAHARSWIDTLRLDSGAPPNEALALAIAREPDAIYFLTDGVTSVDVAAFLREKNRLHDLLAGEVVRVPIHPIAFYSLDGQALLRQIAAENEGQFMYVPPPRQP
ncbi:MAG: VWA domain-containing protein [Planctomycetales bacterium]|nr:VWA domain-containing protein [Planctomycetales bacterium]